MSSTKQYASSSIWQSSGLQIRRLWVQVLPGVPNPNSEINIMRVIVYDGITKRLRASLVISGPTTFPVFRDIIDATTKHKDYRRVIRGFTFGTEGKVEIVAYEDDLIKIEDQ